MSRDDHYGFVQSESLASMQCSSVPDLRAVMHFSRPTLLCAHAYITLSKLHAINVIQGCHSFGDKNLTGVWGPRPQRGSRGSAPCGVRDSARKLSEIWEKSGL